LKFNVAWKSRVRGTYQSAGVFSNPAIQTAAARCCVLRVHAPGLPRFTAPPTMAAPSPGQPEPTPAAEQELVRRLVGGDQRAWEEFVGRYQNLVWTCVRRTAERYRLNPSTADLEDTVAEVFAALLERDCSALQRFQGRCSLATWLIVITRRRCLRRVRKRRPRPIALPDGDVSAVTTEAGDPLADLIRAEDQQFVRSAFDRLSAADRHVLELHHHQKLGYAEISRALGISMNSVGPRIHRAQQRLRKLLERRAVGDAQGTDHVDGTAAVAGTGRNRTEWEHG
jgi:RNA polymerase sigma-70 factor (ECF subfamily)